MTSYQKLFSPGKIGKLELRNRIVMPAMESALNSTTGEANDRIIRYYEERAKGGCGLIITEITRVMNGTGIGHPAQLNAASLPMIYGLEQLANAVHRHGSRVFCQLHHPGREGREMFCGEKIVGPSAIKSLSNDEVPRELTTEEVGQIVSQFITAAKFCQIAGIDGVELHGAHGYLIQQFMCEYSNQRTDKYGGDFTKRMKFVSEIVMMIKMVCGPDFPVCVRINGDDFFEGGMTLDDAVEIAKHLETIGVDAINVSAGGYAAPNESTEPISYPQGWKRHLAKRIKESISIPVIACDVIRKPDFAEELLTIDNLDFVALGRAQLADPEWGNKAKAGLEREIRPCISCLYCAEQVGIAHCIKCAVNPRTSNETVYGEMKQNGGGRLAVVIGGGPAGMQAAISLSERNYKVILFEKRSSLGGYLLLGSVPPNKDKITWLIEYLEVMLEKHNVEVHLNHAVTAADVQALNPHFVFLACGGSSIKPALPGGNLPNVFTIDQVLSDGFTLKDKDVVVVGSGLTGLEVAEYLVLMGNRVKVIEKEYRIAPGTSGGIGTDVSPNVVDVLKHLSNSGVEVKILHELKEVFPDGTIRVDSPDKNPIMRADAVVLSLGVRPDRVLVEDFKSVFSEDNLFVLGDAIKQGRVADAIQSAFECVYYLP